jgi:hypothetical protein
LEEITKDWSKTSLFHQTLQRYLTSTVPETMQDTPKPSRTKKTEEVQDLDSASMKIASISPEQGGNDEEINDKNINKIKVR